ncbi:phytanoyl-CoA dioxygenase family protein [Actinoplanes sp. NPDC048791]|uniref:phytanoyl-CoA dioxygenase family protein n=1 Tax=Actinoplanes sp. NPDC048791 TaxID=3154623 RepID=UPI0033F1BC5F
MLDDDQLSEFRDTGLLRLPGAIAPKDAAAMVERIWDHLHNHGAVRDRPDTWTAGPATGLRAVTGAPAFRALGSTRVRAALDDLLGVGCWQEPRRWGRLLVTFPASDRLWTLPAGGAWHNDFVPLRPGTPVRALQLFTILQDVPARGGGTLVVTGSHHLVTRYSVETGKAPHPSQVRQALGAHVWLRELWEPAATTTPGQRIRRAMVEGVRIGDVDLRVVELTGRAGDSFVMHCDTLHAAAPNAREEPRMMATSIVQLRG